MKCTIPILLTVVCALAMPAAWAQADRAEVPGAVAAIDADELKALLGELQGQVGGLRQELNAEKARSSELERKLQQVEEELGKALPPDALKAVQGEVSEMKTSLNEQRAAAVAMEKYGVDLESLQAEVSKAQTYRFGGNLRLRGVTFDNVWTLNDDLDYDNWQWYRMRTWLWFEGKPAEDLTAYVRLSNEFRYGDAAEANVLSAGRNAQDVYGNKQTFIESAYIDWKMPGTQDISLRLGRQNLIYGEGFVILDGMPYIGSTGLSFDALKAVWKPRPETTVDFFTAKFEEGREAANDDEDLYGIYLTDTSIEKHKAELYFLFKDKRAAQSFGFGDPGLDNPTRGQQIVNSLLAGEAPPAFDDTNALVDPIQKTYTLGTRWSGAITDPLSYAGEIAVQTGEFQDGDGNDDRQGLAGYLRGKYAFAETPWKPAAYLGYIYYSGDDPSTDKYEGWDSLYAEWPKYSELLAYTLYDPFFPLKRGNDPDVGMWTNMQIIRPGVTLAPTEKTTVDLNYNYLIANEDTGPGDGDQRGDLVQAVMTYKFNQFLSGHLWGEWFSPGDYYASDADDAYFARWQLLLNF